MKAPATTIATRPPPGPAQGALPAPAWLVVTLSVALVLTALASLLHSWQRSKR